MSRHLASKLHSRREKTSYEQRMTKDSNQAVQSRTQTPRALWPAVCRQATNRWPKNPKTLGTRQLSEVRDSHLNKHNLITDCRDCIDSPQCGQQAPGGMIPLQ